MTRVEIMSDRPVPEPFCKALTYTNDNLIADAMQDMQMSEDGVRELFHELRLYFYLCYYYADETLPAPAHIDALWHIFLGHEKEYATFCTECFGGIIEHIPHLGKDNVDISKTIDRAHEKFGPRLAVKWQRSTRCSGKLKVAA